MIDLWEPSIKTAEDLDDNFELYWPLKKSTPDQNADSNGSAKEEEEEEEAENKVECNSSDFKEVDADSSIECWNCTRKYKKLSNYMKHKYSFDENDCHIWNKQFKDFVQLKSHVAQNAMKQICCACSIEFDSKVTFLAHVIAKHKIKKSNGAQQPVEKGKKPEKTAEKRRRSNNDVGGATKKAHVDSPAPENK